MGFSPELQSREDFELNNAHVISTYTELMHQKIADLVCVEQVAAEPFQAEQSTNTRENDNNRIATARRWGAVVLASGATFFGVAYEANPVNATPSHKMSPKCSLSASAGNFTESIPQITIKKTFPLGRSISTIDYEWTLHKGVKFCGLKATRFNSSQILHPSPTHVTKTGGDYLDVYNKEHPGMNMKLVSVYARPAS